MQQSLTSKFSMETAFNESVALADIERLYRDYAQQGYDIVGWWGYQGAEAAMEVAGEFPSKQFFFTCAQQNGNNTVSFVYEEEQAGFLSGVLAGLTTKTNKVGVYAGKSDPCANAYANAYELGVSLTKPNAQVLKAYAGSWTDPSEGKQTALTMISNGADFIAKYSLLADKGGMEACRENNVSTTGNFLDQAFMAPSQTLVSIVFQTDVVASQLVTNAIAAQPPIGTQLPVGFENGGFSVKYGSAYESLPQSVKTTFSSWVSRLQMGLYKVPRVETPLT
jgi:basic membrane lipoprotein Med (substrate-binding protein (PBP1-ABC) superfamily)